MIIFVESIWTGSEGKTTILWIQNIRIKMKELSFGIIKGLFNS